MKVMVVGGTGLVGGHTALVLREQGHEVTIMSRSEPGADCLAAFPWRQGDYREAGSPGEALSGFDALVFAAAADIRHLPQTDTEEDFFHRANSVAVPQFFESVRAAGIARAVYIGSWYPQVVPGAIETSAYVRSRHLADLGVRALADDSFRVCSLNAPFILGHLEGLRVPHLEALVHYAAGRLEGLPLVAPAGGVNHMSSRSMAEAVVRALVAGVPGKAYLVGDENLSWKTYLELFCRYAGNPQTLQVSEDEHPMFPDIMLYAGRNATLIHEPDDAELQYARGQLEKTIAEVVGAYMRG